jgi:plasmid stabilization system protein ParE
MPVNVVPTVNLCDPTQEPSDNALAHIMDCVAREAAKRNEQAAKALNDEIDREIDNVLGRSS